jgi:hypothetical protein
MGGQHSFEEGDGFGWLLGCGAVKRSGHGVAAMGLDPPAQAFASPALRDAGCGEDGDAAIPRPIVHDGRPFAGLRPGTCDSKCLNWF